MKQHTRRMLRVGRPLAGIKHRNPPPDSSMWSPDSGFLLLISYPIITSLHHDTEYITNMSGWLSTPTNGLHWCHDVIA